MKRKLIALGLLGVLLSINTLSVFAADIPVTGDPFTATAPSTFVADESQVGGGATVKLPASIDLTYDAVYGAFQYKGNIYCAGSIADGNSVAIKVPRTITYTGSETATELEAFAKIAGSNLYCFTNDDMENNVGKQLLVQIPGADVTKADTFEGTVNFEISMAPLGMYTEVGTGLTSSYYSPGNWAANGVMAVKFTNVDINSVSLRNIKETYQNKGNSAGAYFKKPTGDNSAVKVIDISNTTDIVTLNPYFKPNSGADTGCESSSGQPKIPEKPNKTPIREIDRLVSTNLVTWIMGLDNLNTLILPNDITHNKLRTQIHQDSSYGNWFDYDYYNYNLNDTGAPIGDAIAFVKGIDSNNNWIYVPNIVYRGTITEWKALSANGVDWVFGNAANIVTVHCTDGKLYY